VAAISCLLQYLFAYICPPWQDYLFVEKIVEHIILPAAAGLSVYLGIGSLNSSHRLAFIKKSLERKANSKDSAKLLFYNTTECGGRA